MREVTAERVKEHFGSMVHGDVDALRGAQRARAQLRAAAARSAAAGPRSLRADNLGKTLGGALVRLEIDVPDELADRRAPRPDVGWADAILDELD